MKNSKTFGLYACSYDAYFICDSGFCGHPPGDPTLRSAQMTSSGRMSLSWKSVSNADGYKVRIYNCSKRKHLPFISVEGTTTTIIQTNVRTQLILYPYTATDG